MSVTFCVQLPPEATVAKLSLRRGGVYCFRAAPPAPARHPMAGQSLVDVVTDPAAGTFFGIIASGPVTVRRGKPAAVSLYSEVNVTGADCDLLHTGNALAPYTQNRRLEHFATIDRYVWGVAPGQANEVTYHLRTGWYVDVLGIRAAAARAITTPAPQPPIGGQPQGGDTAKATTTGSSPQGGAPADHTPSTRNGTIDRTTTGSSPHGGATANPSPIGQQWSGGQPIEESESGDSEHESADDGEGSSGTTTPTSDAADDDPEESTTFGPGVQTVLGHSATASATPAPVTIGSEFTAAVSEFSDSDAIDDKIADVSTYLDSTSGVDNLFNEFLALPVDTRERVRTEFHNAVSSAFTNGAGKGTKTVTFEFTGDDFVAVDVNFGKTNLRVIHSTFTKGLKNALRSLANKMTTKAESGQDFSVEVTVS